MANKQKTKHEFLESPLGDEMPPVSHEGLKDQDILLASLNEPAMFEILVERYQDPLTRAAWRVVRNNEEAADIVQEAFVKIYKNAHKFEKMEGIEFKSWAYKITINTAITHYRKLKRGEFLTDDPALFQEITGERVDARIASTVDAKAVVDSTLTQLPDNLQSVLKSYYIDDKSYRTIATEEKISIPALKMRLFRAKKFFKQFRKKDTNINTT